MDNSSSSSVLIGWCFCCARIDLPILVSCNATCLNSSKEARSGICSIVERLRSVSCTTVFDEFALQEQVVSITLVQNDMIIVNRLIASDIVNVIDHDISRRGCSHVRCMLRHGERANDRSRAVGKRNKSIGLVEVVWQERKHRHLCPAAIVSYPHEGIFFSSSCLCLSIATLRVFLVCYGTIFHLLSVYPFNWCNLYHGCIRARKHSYDLKDALLNCLSSDITYLRQ